MNVVKGLDPDMPYFLTGAFFLPHAHMLFIKAKQQ